MIWIVNYYKEIFTDIAMSHMKNFLKVLLISRPFKRQKIRDNHAPFMVKKVSKAIKEKLKTRIMYLKWPYRENYASYKKKCDSLTKKAKKFFLKEATEDGIMSKKGFGVLPNLL